MLRTCVPGIRLTSPARRNSGRTSLAICSAPVQISSPALEYPAAQARRPWATKNRVEAVVGIVSCDCADTGQGKGNASSNATNKAPRVEFKTYSMHALFRRRRTKVRNPQVSGNQAQPTSKREPSTEWAANRLCHLLEIDFLPNKFNEPQEFL